MGVLLVAAAVTVVLGLASVRLGGRGGARPLPPSLVAIAVVAVAGLTNGAFGVYVLLTAHTSPGSNQPNGGWVFIAARSAVGRASVDALRAGFFLVIAMGCAAWLLEHANDIRMRLEELAERRRLAAANGP